MTGSAVSAFGNSKELRAATCGARVDFGPRTDGHSPGGHPEQLRGSDHGRRGNARPYGVAGHNCGDAVRHRHGRGLGALGWFYRQNYAQPAIAPRVRLRPGIPRWSRLRRAAIVDKAPEYTIEYVSYLSRLAETLHFTSAPTEWSATTRPAAALSPPSPRHRSCWRRRPRRATSVRQTCRCRRRRGRMC